MSTVPATKKTNALLLRYLAELSSHPLRTKAITTATLCFLQEVLGSTIAGFPVQRPPKDAPSILHILAALNVDLKALKMALYGFLVSAPLGHFLTGALQKAFAGKTGTGAKIGQILANSLLVSPITTTSFLASMAVINGAKTLDEVIKTVKAGFWSVLRISWVVSPVSLVIAQKFIPLDLWVPFFSSVQFVLGTFFNIRVKQMRIAAAKKAEHERREKEKDTNKA
ncbi:putative peroxisomal membrane protein PXMP2 4 family protein [Lyophyllum shimeji]|uniref:Peroxisomal membrane protein PXMP2 4 family protein n=1 Tax=Lyophyllum shimeji TaxID=47721 RepID=A0A9P3PIF4_LYOSH|nr:putative peroxisomal membrane protein PXMP2 4 family protein [Lyophyllum shimeji]